MIFDNEYIKRKYHCRVCDETHDIELNTSLSKNYEKFPFSYSFLHGELRNILTTLYLDKEIQIRGVDVQVLKDDDLFSKDQVVEITETLMKEIERLRRENDNLQIELENLKKRS
jgi:hypothetical protein